MIDRARALGLCWNVGELSSITADLGWVTAGHIDADVIIASESFIAAAAGFTGDINLGVHGVSGGHLYTQGPYSGIGVVDGGTFDVLDTDGDAVIGVRGFTRELGFFDRANYPIPVPNVVGARDDPEGALASLLTALDALGLIIDDTTAS